MVRYVPYSGYISRWNRDFLSEERVTQMNDSTQTGYYTIGEWRDKPRIWLQGSNLESANFTKGCFYNVEFDVDSETITYRLTDKPNKYSRKVSGRKKPNGSYCPIIDLASVEILDVTKGSRRIRADFLEGEIRVTIHHLVSKQKAREERLKANLASGEITKGVLCSGIGMSTAAIHDGLAEMGIKARTEFIVDRERRYLDVAVQNNHAISPSTKIFEARLEELETELLGYVDALSFSLPCTGPSKAGKAKNQIKYAEEHPTDALAIIGLIRTIDACQPSILYSENVVEARGTASYILLKSMLDASGYNIQEIVLDSSDTKSIENRRRWWFVATSKGLNIAELDTFPQFSPLYETVGDLLEDIPSDSNMWKSTKEKLRKEKVNSAKGNNFKLSLFDQSSSNIGVAGKGYQKDRATEPHLAGPANTMRLFTKNEICLAQSAPIHLIKDTVTATAYEGLGQGIDYRQGVGVAIQSAIHTLLPLMDTENLEEASNLGDEYWRLFVNQAQSSSTQFALF